MRGRDVAALLATAGAWVEGTRRLALAASRAAAQRAEGDARMPDEEKHGIVRVTLGARHGELLAPARVTHPLRDSRRKTAAEFVMGCAEAIAAEADELLQAGDDFGHVTLVAASAHVLECLEVLADAS